MAVTITPEYVMHLGEEIKRVLLETLLPEELLAGLKPEERVAGLKPEERVAGVKPDELLALISFEDIEAYLESHRPKPETPDEGDK